MTYTYQNYFGPVINGSILITISLTMMLNFDNDITSNDTCHIDNKSNFYNGITNNDANDNNNDNSHDSGRRNDREH